MRNRSVHGGRHVLGQNFLTHRPTIATILDLVDATDGPILEIGAGAGALTVPLAATGRPVRAVELDEHRVGALRRRLPGVDVARADALIEPFDRAVIVGNLPFHLTTPLLRRLLRAPTWRHAVVITQWEVARKRAGVGGSTMLTAQAAPWFEFSVHGRVPAAGFSPRPGVDGGILAIQRRRRALIDERERRRYERFVASAFTARGRGVARVLRNVSGAPAPTIDRALRSASVGRDALPRDLNAQQWAVLWREVGEVAHLR